jgi:endonuclease-3
VKKAERIKWVNETIAKLKKLYPDAHCALYYKTPFQLLIATILSAQTTDEKVNQVTPELFKIYPDSKTLAQANVAKVESLISSINYYKTKAKNIIASSKMLEERFKGEVPTQIEHLLKLPGVGRKTANVVLGNAFNIASGIVVDTHVGRLSRRLGWTRQTDPEKVDFILQNLIPKPDWIIVSHLLIYHGRKICMARNPQCQICDLSSLCLRRI